MLDTVPEILPLPKGMNANILKYLEKLDAEYRVIGLKSTLAALQQETPPHSVYIDADPSLDPVTEPLLMLCNELEIPITRVAELSNRLSKAFKLKNCAVFSSKNKDSPFELPTLKHPRRPIYKIPKVTKVNKI